MLPILPYPTRALPGDGGADLSSGGVVEAPFEWWRALAVVLDPLGAALGTTFVFGGGTEPLVRVAADPTMTAEGYSLVVSEGHIEIRAGGATGAAYALQTMRQLMDPSVHRAAGAVDGRVRACVIEDAPALEWRGLMLDVSRHFPGKAWTLRLIDVLAQLKMNVLHLHLTDDQGWRIEIDAFPRLTEVGAYRRETLVGGRFSQQYDGTPHGGFYTKADIREIIAYASLRGITVVPEVDMPGHMVAAIAAYPEWGVTGKQIDVLTRWARTYDVLNLSDTTVAALKTIIDEIIELFPSEWIHIGGDECPRDQWEADDAVQAIIRERGLRDADELQHWLTRQMGDHIASRGRKMVGWDEILNGELPDNATVMAWRDEQQIVEAVKLDRDVIVSVQQQYYFDFRQDPGVREPLGPRVFDIYLTELDDVFAYDWPEGVDAEGNDRILGIQAQLWTEFVSTTQRAEYLLFPRLLAVAERAWWGRGAHPEGFTQRVRAQFGRFDAAGVQYRPIEGPRQDQAGSWFGVEATADWHLLLSSNDAPTDDK